MEYVRNARISYMIREQIITEMEERIRQHCTKKRTTKGSKSKRYTRCGTAMDGERKCTFRYDNEL